MVLQCTMLSADFGLDAVRIKLRDRLSLLDKAGNQCSRSPAPRGVEGSEDQAGSPKPRLLGDTYFIPLVLLDHGLQLYFVHQARHLHAGVHAHSVRRRRRADARQ